MTYTRMVAGLSVFAYLAQLVIVPVVLANPAGPTVVGGHATVSGLGTSQVTIAQASQQAIINWQQFNIAPNEVTQFIQPNVHAIALNRIFDQNPSQIFGSLSANGTVILLNPNGIMFGPNAQVNVGGLIASSLNLSNANFLAGRYLFEGAGIEGPVKNMGAINASYDGIYLLAPNVENSGVMTSPGGTIVLAAGAKAFLSNRPDGRGFLAEISNPVGQAVNLKDLIADGGNISLAGRVVNQQGLVQANSVREKRGKIELYASETLILKAGSQTMAKGGKEGRSDGGTILAIADKFTGTAKFEKGATVDVSGGRAGGHAGFVELSGSRVGLGGKFIGTANPGFRSGRLLIDPTVELDLTGFTATDFANISFATPRDASGNLLAGYDLRVTGTFDLNTVQPPPTGGTIRFDAGQDLIFRDLTLWNNPFGAPTKWDIVGVAERNILFTGSTGTTLQTAYGGGIDLTAKLGDVNLIDPQTGALSTIRTQGGGGISIKTGQDLVASTGFNDSGGPLGLFNVQGINIDGPGRLNLDVGRDFIGGPVDGVPHGPGFVLWNTDLTVTPQHTVNVGGKIGETNLTLGPNGLPLTVAEQRANNLPPTDESSARYADFALSNGDLTVTAGGNIYLGRIRDAGLVGGLDAAGNLREPAFAAGLENNKATIVSREGNIIINTSTRSLGQSQAIPDLGTLMGILPASFEARADKGTIQIRSSLTFLPSPTGSVKFTANQNIEGVSTTSRANDETNFFWLFVGFGGAAGGQWIAVDRRTIQQHPEYWPFLNRPLSPDIQRTKPDASKAFPEYARIDVETSPPTVKLMEGNPADLAGNTNYSALVSQSKAREPILPAENTTALSQVSFKAETGNISNLFLDLVSRAFHKEVSIEAGNRIEQVSANIYLPNLGTQTQTVTEHVPLFLDTKTGHLRSITPTDVILIHDPITGLVRPWNKTESVDPANLVNVVLRDATVTVTAPKAAATITAQDITLGRGDSGEGILAFSGPVTARVIAKGTLDLANGQGISMERNIFDRNNTTDQGGLLDIAVGNNLNMVTSGIFSQNGAGVSIHGYDPAKPYVVGYDNSSLYPLEFPDSVRGGINLPAIGGRVNVGENNARSQGNVGSPTGIQVRENGSVGQRAEKPIVNPDGTVTVNLVKDPAAILIRATGDIDVNKSRIATFGGGDIRLTSVSGNINAGSGSKNERVQYSITVNVLDSNGNPKVDPSSGEILKEVKVYTVPGSGIFTFHPNDPQPLVFPTFNDPQINALLAEADRQGFLGRDVSGLLAQANRLKAEREPVFNETVLNPFVDRLKLGNITLTVERGNIIIPPAGIRGRDITLIAPHGVVDFQGGALIGRVDKANFPVVVGTPNIPVLSPPGVGPAPPPLSGGGVVGAASTTAVAGSTSAKSTESVQETAAEVASQNSQSKQVASTKRNEKEEKSQLAKSIRVKHGVVIQVDVKPEVKSGG